MGVVVAAVIECKHHPRCSCYEDESPETLPPPVAETKSTIEVDRISLATACPFRAVTPTTTTTTSNRFQAIRVADDDDDENDGNGHSDGEAEC